MWFCAGIVTELLVDVLESSAVPLQPETDQPALGFAVREMTAPAWYHPLEHPEELEGEATGSEPLPEWVRVSK